LVKEAQQLRDSVELGTLADGPAELHKRLLQARACIDRLEAITRTISLLKGRTAIALDDAQYNLDDAYAKVVGKTRRGDDYSTGKEREAGYSVGTVAEQVAWRRAKTADREAYTALEFCRSCQKGAESVRWDLDTVIRLLTLEGRLDH